MGGNTESKPGQENKE